MITTFEPSLAGARKIAQVAHEGQVKWSGEAFLDHVYRVAGRVETHEEKIVALLHDVIEKAEDWSLDDLHAIGFSHDIVAAVDALTRREGEDYEAFCRRACANPLARPVKQADLIDNLEQAKRLGRDGSKYEQGLHILAQLNQQRQ
ncbi:metal-dependent phosphohydrolase [Rhizobium sp. SSA_523]|uniref:metal-dependent phosphohydrolase n=1 Tax=Rhizobium sp. SSA_523 TaxID=2952477 RepID=UPI0020917926|nr:metal-dependent phosphohydrolase [Rhizobium sp. SSA_523]MCO5732271.1 metal-dependent phosphohydrolase [Rhizobium sp. SSA_523]WKC21324.1 metal-dependent phosphohydrolase [Rhizobium sp. SSA_523]